MSRRNGRVRCDEVREVLPEYAEPGPRPAGAVEVHLASCAACSVELESYRTLLSDLADYRDVDVAAPEEFLGTTLRTARSAALRRRIPGRVELRAASLRAAEVVRHRPGVRYAAVTIGGAAAGATAIAIVWWSTARRAVPGAL